MPDTIADPVADMLRRQQTLSDAQRHALWNAYHAATDEDDLAAKLKPLQFPNTVKHDLWDLKAGRASPPAAAAAPEVPRTARNLFGFEVTMPADVAAQHHAAQERVAGRQPPLGGEDIVIQNARGVAGYAPAAGAYAGYAFGGPIVAGLGGAAGEAINLAANPEQRSDSALGVAGQIAGTGVLSGALSAVPFAAARVPTRAKAAAKFAEVARAVNQEPVDVARAGDAALRIADLAQRGGGTVWGPAPVRQFIQYVTDPRKPQMTYEVARDFYSNISRLSGDELKRMAPVIRRELGGLREALHEALAKTAASGGKEEVFRAAMREYRLASRAHELALKAAKWGAGLIGAGTAYKVGKDILE